jgi:hypothetical protein
MRYELTDNRFIRLAAGRRLGPDHGCTGRWARRGGADDRYFGRAVHQHGACIADNNHQDMGRARDGV